MTDKPITATGSGVLPPLRVLPAGPPHTYLGIAGAMLEGVKVLAASQIPPALPLALLAAHVLECALKAYLSRDGDDSRVRHADIRHNLGALWSLAHAEGLSIPSSPPQWVNMLSHLHKSPYYLRYSTGVHGIGSPAAEPMTAELSALLGRALKPRLAERSDQSVEFKHANISAALLAAGFPYINGYKPRSNYQALVAEVIAERLESAPQLLEIAAADADRPIAVPEVDDILAVLTQRPQPKLESPAASEPTPTIIRLTTNYIEREARNRSLGNAGELFVLNYERARLIHARCEALAAKIEHTAKVRGDHAGYDILSFEDTGAERLIEVKTTKYGSETPFFVTRNEVSTSERHAHHYQLYRLFAFREMPRLYTLPGAIGASCRLSAATFLASPK